MMAMANRNSAEALVLMIPPIEARGERRGGERNANRQGHHHGRVSERKEEADADRALALLHEPAGNVVDRRDMIGIDCVPQAKGIGEQSRPEQERPIAEDQKRPEPDNDVAADQHGVNGDQSAAQVSTALIQYS